jgi:transposase
MFYPESQARIWLCTQPTDMRKSFNGLIGIVHTKLEQDPLSGELFVFVNRRKTHIKILYFDGSGHCIWLKRLEQGQFNFRGEPSGRASLDWTQLKLLLAGIEVEKFRQYKRYFHHKPSNS